jgi:YD repeat-containing protein
MVAGGVKLGQKGTCMQILGSISIARRSVWLCAILLCLWWFLPHAAHADGVWPTQAIASSECQAFLRKSYAADQVDLPQSILFDCVVETSTVYVGPPVNWTYASATPSQPCYMALVFNEWNAGNEESEFCWNGSISVLSSAKNAGDGAGCNGGEGSHRGDITCPIASGAPTRGDPINTATGNKYLQDEDYSGGWLTFRRFYNSATALASTAMGAHWRHSFDRSLQILNSPATVIIAFRPDGKQEVFNKINGAWTTDSDVADQLMENDSAQGVAISYTLFVAALRHQETYDATTGLLLTATDEAGNGISLTYSAASTPASVAPNAGLLLNVTDLKGRQLNFTYSSSGQLHQVTLPDGGTLTYTYDAWKNLRSTQYPDGKTRQYVYNESSLTGGATLFNATTGIVDEAGVRYENTTYDSDGLTTSSSLVGNVDTTQITYNSDGTSTIQYPLGGTSTMSYSTTNTGLVRVASLNQPCNPACSEPWKTRTFDANGNPLSATDFNGNVTATTYNSVNLLTQRVEAQGQSTQRTMAITWNTSLRVPLTQTVSDANNNLIANTQWAYSSLGEPLARCDIDPSSSAASGYNCSNTGTESAGVRRWTYTYCTVVDTTQCPLVGLLLTATGPRTDTPQTTTYSYYLASSTTNCGTPGAACYQAGDLHTVTDPQGHVTTIASYDGAGRITRTTDANGINTDLTYTPRGWLASRSVGGATTGFTYTPYGAVQTTTDADGVTTTYGYDAAHRLVKITDAQGNYVQYTLDAAGNKTAEQTYDASGTLHKSLARSFNTLGQLTKVMDGLSHTIFDASASNSYDANGNLVQSADGLGIQRQLGYDALNRLVQTLDNYNGTN